MVLSMYFRSALLKKSKYSLACAAVSKIGFLIFIAQYHVKHHVCEYKDKETSNENSDNPVKHDYLASIAAALSHYSLALEFALRTLHCDGLIRHGIRIVLNFYILLFLLLNEFCLQILRLLLVFFAILN